MYRNAQGAVEMEFLIENADGVIPVEIKAGGDRYAVCLCSIITIQTMAIVSLLNPFSHRPFSIFCCKKTRHREYRLLRFPK